MPVKVECESCKAPYSIDERRIPAAGLRVRCPKCTKTFVVKKPAEAAGEEGLPAVKEPEQHSETTPGVGGGQSRAKMPAQAPPVVEPSLLPSKASGPSSNEPDDLPAPVGAGDAQLPAQRSLAAKKPVIKGTALGLGGLVPGAVRAAGVQARSQAATQTDLPAQRGASPSAGEPDLPAARAPAPAAPAPAIAKPSFDVDLPSVGRGIAPRPQSKTKQGFDDLPALASDLPSPAQRADLPSPAQRADLPSPAQRADLPSPAQRAELPAAVTRADLPAQRGDLPAATHRNDLPAPKPVKTKMEFGEIDLPSVGVARDLSAQRSSTQKFGEGDLPEISGHLPATRSHLADLPSPGQAHLPAIAATAANLPGVRGDDFGGREPAIALPVPGDPFDQPPRGRDFAVAQTMVGPGVQPPSSFDDSSGFGELELPGPGAASHNPWSNAASAPDLGLRTPTARGFGEIDLGGDPLGPSPRAATGVEASGVNAPSLSPPNSLGSDFGELELPGPGGGMGASPSADTYAGEQRGYEELGAPNLGDTARSDSRGTGGVGFGEVDLGGGASGDDALEFGAIPEEKRGESGGSGGATYDAPMPKSRADKLDVPAEPEVEKRSGNAGRVFLALLVVGLIGGAALQFNDRLGAFGYRAISDKLNAEKYAGLLTSAVKRTREGFGDDALPRANAAIVELQKDVSSAERYSPLMAYTAYAQFAHELRYGKDPQRDTLARSALAKVTSEVPHKQLAEAARDVVAGQLPGARSTLKSIVGSDATNVDAWVTLGDLELRAKQPKDAIAAFEAAVKARDDARTHNGLMRAHDAAGNIEKAKAEAIAIAAKYPTHAASRLLLARYAWERDKDEKESMKWLSELEKANVVATASLNEQVDAQTVRGNIHLERGRVSSAKKAFEDAIAAAKGTATPGPRLGLGEVYLATGQFPQAITEFSLASQANPEAALPKIGIARAFLKQEKASEAKAQLVGVKDPVLAGETGFWLGQAEEKISPERPSEPIRIYEAAIKAQPNEVKPYIALANLQAKTGKMEEADATLASAAKNVPPSERLHLGIGEMRFRQERYDQALEQFNKALDLQPGNLAALFSKAKTLLRMGERVRLDEGKAVLDQVAAKDDKYPGLPLEYGLYFQKTSQINEALDQYKKALERAPDDVDIQLSVARAQVEAHMKEAEPRLLEIMSSCGKSPSPDVCSAEANHYYGRALLTRGDAASAKVYLEKAASRNDNNAQYHLYLAWSHVELNSLVEADKEVTRSLELDKSLATAHWLRGEIDAKSGRYKEAIENAKRALTISKSLPQAHATIAWSLRQLNQEEGALVEFEKAIKADPTNPRSAFWRFTVADILHHRNAITRAVPELKEAIRQAKAMAPPPTWVPKAHFYLGEALRHSDRAEAIKEYREYLATSVGSTDPARKEAETAVRELAGK